MYFSVLKMQNIIPSFSIKSPFSYSLQKSRVSRPVFLQFIRGETNFLYQSGKVKLPLNQTSSNCPDKSEKYVSKESTNFLLKDAKSVNCSCRKLTCSLYRFRKILDQNIRRFLKTTSKIMMRVDYLLFFGSMCILRLRNGFNM